MLRTVRNWIAILLTFLYCATLFAYVGTGVFNAPDEHATALFIEATRVEGVPRIEEMRNAHLAHVLHPRSTTVVNSYIVPIGFLGMPFWYGVLSAWIHVPAIVFTPFLVIVALGAFYALMKKYLHSSRRALLATVLLATLPAFWYYAARSFMPNVPFVSLLLLAFVVFDLRPGKAFLPWWFHGILAGALFGVSLSFRFFEFPWILILLAVYLFTTRHSWCRHDLLLVVLGASLVLLPVLALHQELYGHWFWTGYTVPGSATHATDPVLSEAVAAFAGVPAPAYWTSLLFPFGIHERLILSHVFENVFVLMPLLVFFGLLGWGCVLIRKEKKWWILAGIVVALAAWLFVVYGSWRITDNPDPHAVTLANSYSRYWLPIYLLAIPFVLMGMEQLAMVISPKRAKIITAFFVGAWVLFGAVSVLRGPDGFLASRMRLYQFADDRQVLLSAIPEDAIVIVQYADKYLYPDRSVAIGLTSASVIYAMPSLLAEGPLYYFGITLPEKDLNFYQATLLDKLSVAYRLVPILTVREQTLYRFEAL